VRRWAREGVLRPGYRGGWQWTREGETVASIQMRAEQDRVILIYRHRPISALRAMKASGAT
jgi:hypothetical protein